MPNRKIFTKNTSLGFPARRLGGSEAVKSLPRGVVA